MDLNTNTGHVGDYTKSLLLEIAKHNKTAIWVGGPPGKTFLKFKKNFSRINIHIVDQWHANQNKTTIPQNIDLVIINKDFIGHEQSNKAKMLAEKFGIQWVWGSIHTIKTIENMQAKKILPDGLPSGLIRKLMEENTAKEEYMSAYHKKIATVLGDCVGHDNEEYQNNFLQFFSPEIAKGTTKLLKWFGSDIPSKITSETIEKSIEFISSLDVDPNKKYSVGEIQQLTGKKDFKGPRKNIIVLAVGGYVCRMQPFEVAVTTGKESYISINFKFTKKGREMLESKKSTSTAVNNTVIPNNNHIPPSIHIPGLIDAPVIQNAKELVESIKPETMRVAEKIMNEPVKEARSSGDLEEALRMVMEIVSKDHPEYRRIILDIKQKKFDVELVTTQSFKL